MISRERIENHASQRAADLFIEHKLDDTVLQAPEAIAALAEEKAILYIHQHPRLKSEQEAEDLYRITFIEGYTQYLERDGAASVIEDGILLLGLFSEDPQ